MAPVLVAGWPPVALLQAVELLAHRSRTREHSEIEPAAPTENRERETDSESGTVITLAEIAETVREAERGAAAGVVELITRWPSP